MIYTNPDIPYSPSSSQNKKGVALILCMLAMIMVMSMIYVMYLNTEAVHKQISLEIAIKGQAVNIGYSGLVDTINWFRKYYSDRGNFDPQQNLLADPVINESDVPVIGLVREHVISIRPDLIGRYEIRRQTADVGTTNPATIDTQYGVKNIQTERKSVKPIFYLQANAYIFEPRDKATYQPTAFYLMRDHEGVQIPNAWWDSAKNGYDIRYDLSKIRLIAQSTVACEIVQSQLRLPYNAAICHRGTLTVGTKGEVRSYETVGSTGAARPTTTATATISGGVVNPADYAYPDYEDSIDNVFGLPNEETLTVGNDKLVFASNTSPGFKIGEYKYTFIGTPGESPLPTFTFTDTLPLTAKNAVVYIRGNVVVASGSNSFFSGILYVVGNLEIRDPAYFSGAVIVLGNTLVQGSIDSATVVYQRSLVEDLQSIMGQYTFYRPPYVIESGKQEETLQYP